MTYIPMGMGPKEVVGWISLLLFQKGTVNEMNLNDGACTNKKKNTIGFNGRFNKKWQL